MSELLTRSDSHYFASVITQISRILEKGHHKSLQELIDQVRGNTPHYSAGVYTKIIETFPKKLFSTEFQFDAKTTGETQSIDTFIKWEEDFQFYHLCAEAIIDARKVGDSFIVLDDGNPLDTPITRPPIDISRLSNASVDDRPFLNFGEDKIHYSRVLHWYGQNIIKRVSSRTEEWQTRFTNNPIITGVLENAINLLDLCPEYLFQALKTASQYSLEVDGLADILYSDLANNTSEAKSQVEARTSAINQGRSMHSLMVTDMNMEKLSALFGKTEGLRELVEGIKNYIAINTELPERFLFDTASNTGMGSGLQNQLVARFDLATRVKNWGDYAVLPNLRKVTRLFGNFKTTIPLRIPLNAVEAAEYEKTIAERNSILIRDGVVCAREVREIYRPSDPRTPHHLVLDDALFEEEMKSKETEPPEDPNNLDEMDSQSKSSEDPKPETKTRSDSPPDTLSQQDNESLSDIPSDLLELNWEELALVTPDIVAQTAIKAAETYNQQ